MKIRKKRRFFVPWFFFFVVVVVVVVAVVVVVVVLFSWCNSQNESNLQNLNLFWRPQFSEPKKPPQLLLLRRIYSPGKEKENLHLLVGEMLLSDQERFIQVLWKTHENYALQKVTNRIVFILCYTCLWSIG